MVVEGLTPVQIGRDFVTQYYAMLKSAPEMMIHEFYGKNTSDVHGGLESPEKAIAAVSGPKEIHREVASLHSLANGHVEILHLDAQATLNKGIVVQVLGLLSTSDQAPRHFVQTLVLAPQDSSEGKFYVHNDIFSYQDEVLGGFITESQEEAKEEAKGEPEAELEPVREPQEEKLEAILEEAKEEAKIEPEEAELEPVREPQEEKLEAILEEAVPEAAEKSPAEQEAPKNRIPEDAAPKGQVSEAQEDEPPVSWASMVCKNLGPVTGTPPQRPKVPASQPSPESKPESQKLGQQEQRGREAGTNPAPRGPPRPLRDPRQPGSLVPRRPRSSRHPNSHQLFLGNLPHEVQEQELLQVFQAFGKVLELRVLSGGEAPDFGFVVFDGCEPVQKALSRRPITIRGGVRLNVQEKRPRAALRDSCPGGAPGSGPRGPPRGNLMQMSDSEVGENQFP
ncbi:ras GTPase-activating protein-binding protein 1-like [Suncus etruscus]|uniref:ras GTPase-activating protein-binding protein 1-like n=1 Tax=Suncus etruscus TaxID=109475 RepID=UPI00210F2418|nr:ras GTPase-activating protein-binding protein 1-like [Suncus etruscus]